MTQRYALILEHGPPILQTSLEFLVRDVHLE